MLKGEKCTDLAACSCRTKAETMARSLNSRIWPGTWGSDRHGLEKMPNHHHQEDEEFFEASPPSPVEDEEQVQRVDSSAATVAGRAKLYELLQQHAADDATDVFYDVSENAESPDLTSEKKEGNSKINCSSEKLFSDANVKNITVNGKCETFSENSRSILDDENTVCDIEKSNIVDNSAGKMDTKICHDLSPESKNEHVLNSELLMKNKIINGSVINSSSDVILQTSNENKANLIMENNIDYTSHENRDDSSITSDLNFPAETINTSCNSNDCSTTENSELKKCDDNSEESLKCDSDTAFTSPVKITEDKASPTKLNFPPVDSDLQDFKDSPRLKAFDENRPMISRSTSLKTGKTPPGTPSRKKIVRFADVLGLDLEDVRTIISGDIPTIPQSAYSDLKLDEEDQPLSQTSSTIEIRDRQQGSWENIRTAIGPNTLYPMFPIPGQQINFWDRVQSQGICLESVTVSDSNVQCTCRVMNWGFHKRVCVRYSSNNWLTSSDIDASYVSGSSQNNSDSFTFNIFLPISCRNVEFALRYEINGKEYWDNNNGKNYRFSCHSNTSSMHGPSSPTFVHQFW